MRKDSRYRNLRSLHPHVSQGSCLPNIRVVRWGRRGFCLVGGSLLCDVIHHTCFTKGVWMSCFIECGESGGAYISPRLNRCLVPSLSLTAKGRVLGGGQGKGRSEMYLQKVRKDSSFASVLHLVGSGLVHHPGQWYL